MPKLPFKFRHVPALDGIRGIAILSVMFFHSPVFNLQGGFIGVDIFFVLSGFLITSLLLKEHAETQQIDLKNFYIRRILRLMPAMIIVLGSLLVMSIILQNKFATSPTSLGVASLYTLFYFSNWAIILELTNWPAAIIHFWSLAIEEQFYLFWPFLFTYLLRKKIKVPILSWLLLTACICFLVWRIYLWQNGSVFARVYFATDTRINGLLIGCLCSIIVSQNLIISWIKRHATGIFLAACCGVAACMFFMNNTDGTTYCGGFELVEVLTSLVIIGVLYSRSSLVKVFELKVLVWFGKLSYGIYLWHGIIFYFLEKINFPLKDNNIAYLLAEFGITLFIATLSYNVIEQRFLKLKHKYSTVNKAINKRSTITSLPHWHNAEFEKVDRPSEDVV